MPTMDAAVADDIAADLQATLAGLARQELITPEEAKSLEEEIERIRQSAEERVDASTWEAADTLRENVAASLSGKQDDAVDWATESLERYAPAAQGGATPDGKYRSRGGRTDEGPGEAWVDEDTLEARFPVHSAGLYLGAVQLGGGAILPLAPLSLPYSPEFELREDPDEGEKTLREIARVTGGVERTTWDDVFDPHRLAGRQVRDLVLPRVVEIAGRRLLWFDAARSWLRAVRLRLLGRAVARAPVPSTPSSELRPSRDPARRVWQAVLTSPVR